MPGQGIGAGGNMGIGFESVAAGTYAVPTKWFPIASESLVYEQANEERRVIRGVADSLGSTPSDGSVSGEVSLEVLSDVLPYFLYAGRFDVVKSGAGPYNYIATGNHEACATTGRTLSIHVIRNGIVFAYVGCVAGGFNFSIDNGKLMVTIPIIGEGEAVQTIGVPAYANQDPFGKGTYTIQLDAGTVTDIDAFTFEVADNATPEFRLKNSTDAEFVRFGERNVTATYGRDFISRADYDLFRALTAQSVDILASHAAGDQVQLEMPVGIKETYEIGLSAQGDLVRSAIELHGDYDATVTAAVRITVDTPTENIT